MQLRLLHKSRILQILLSTLQEFWGDLHNNSNNRSNVVLISRKHSHQVLIRLYLVMRAWHLSLAVCHPKLNLKGNPLSKSRTSWLNWPSSGSDIKDSRIITDS